MPHPAKVVSVAVAEQGQAEARHERLQARQEYASSVRRFVEQLNQRFARERVGFGLEEKLGVLYVQIYDRSTGEVLREFPPSELLRQQAALAEMIGLILNRKA